MTTLSLTPKKHQVCPAASSATVEAEAKENQELEYTPGGATAVPGNKQTRPCAAEAPHWLGTVAVSPKNCVEEWETKQHPYRQLTALGVCWDIHEEKWRQKFRLLGKYHTECGDVRVPYDHPDLGQWCIKQRHLAKTGRLTDERMRALQGLGFLFSPREDVWEQHFLELESYKRNHGDCLVPAGWRENGALAAWVEDMRRRRRQGIKDARRDETTITTQQERRLASLGFVWEPRAASWEERLGELKTFKELHGHLEGPFPPRLHQWVITQRHFGCSAEGCMSLDRRRRLSLVGFNWGVDDSVFQTRISQLQELISEHGLEKVYVALERNTNSIQGSIKSNKGTSNGTKGALKSMKPLSCVNIPPVVGKWYRRQKKYVLNESPCLNIACKHKLADLGFDWALPQDTNGSLP
eukprot:CAMPEP_0196595006 /NCGR_PEP_ID=MMETSP1081-20130531/79898_1 /TAXON_ID=36882 /ORGANISM="Pyramimonas amylifera, Strain CCMP720" /LENGTH=409 /DNA_ID=CAMNT_0041919439 /DNA_START=256 /DNA_END=1487 /DNA_ORIENTATION=-